MPSPEPSVGDRAAINRTVEAVIRIAVIAGLIGWCFVIARPFLVPIIWGAIIAVTVFHGYKTLEVGLRGRRTLAAVLVTLFMLILLVVPPVLLGDSLVSGASKLMASFKSGDFSIPPPPDNVARWPLIGEPLARACRPCRSHLCRIPVGCGLTWVDRTPP
jgi:predicted PurR-regulated permease PerM